MSQLRWPLHPRPLNEESILSWLTRIANCYELTVENLLIHDLGFHGNPNDLYVNIPNGLLSLLSSRTGFSEQNIRALTLSSWTPLLYDRLDVGEDCFESYVRQYSLLLPIKIRGKFQPRHPWRPWLSNEEITISKACPVCVSNEPIGVTLLAWCLPIMLSCPVHQCLLRQCYTYQGCYLCWKEEHDPLFSFSTQINSMDQRTWSALTTGQVRLPRRTIHGGVWLRLLRTLIDELHIPASLSSPSPHAKKIINLWESLGLVPRGGAKRWYPYELLPEAIQQNTLLAAATVISQIEQGQITPPGSEVALFLPERVEANDLPSHPPQKPHADSKLKSESALLSFVQHCDKVIEIAKTDPNMAMRLRSLMLIGKNDNESIQKVDKLLIDGGIPKEFIVL